MNKGGLNMAKKKAKEKKEFVEFNVKSETFDFSGRIYPGKEKKGLRRSWMSLCLNDSITIQNCYLVETKSSTFIGFPQYKNKDDEYKSHIFIDEDMREEIDNLAEVLAGKISEDV